LFLYADLLKARTTADITAVATSITIDDASTLPTLGSGEYFIVKMSQGTKLETMQCTAVAGNVLTVVRATHYPLVFKSGALCVVSIDPDGYELVTGGSGLTQAQILARQSIGF